MEIWLRLAVNEEPMMNDVVDKIWSNAKTQNHLSVEDDTVFFNNEKIGAHIHIRDGASQKRGIELMGSADWLLVECETWSMIPLENLISAREGSNTKIAAVITSPEQAQGAGFALEQGVDALVVANQRELIEAALSVKAQRLEREPDQQTHLNKNQHDITLQSLQVIDIIEAGLGDRYCLDFLSLFSVGEGILVGSSSACMLIIHSESLPSSFVPQRPFRINAGSPHSYVMMADMTTKYISELAAGSHVLAINAEGKTRPMVLGRIKIEQRPMFKITVAGNNNGDEKPNESHVFMQQAETVRLLTTEALARSITSLQIGEKVLGVYGHGARHLGHPISSRVEER